MKSPLGHPLPAGDAHAVSVSLPTWKDVLAWARREPDLLAQLQTGYPRFFIPLLVRTLAERLLQWATSSCKSALSLLRPDHVALLFATEQFAKSCQEYLVNDNDGSCIILQFEFNGHVYVGENIQRDLPTILHDRIYAVVYSPELSGKAKEFWQHTGLGVSSRTASFWLDNAPFLNEVRESSGNMHLPFNEADEARRTLRDRITGLLSTEVDGVLLDDVYLFPTGMAAINQTAIALSSLRHNSDAVCKVAVFGFLYVDTFKVLSRVHRLECVLYGNGTSSDLDALETDLRKGVRLDALYTEFPGNPLLGAADLERLYALGNEFSFFLIVDDTVGTSVNVNILSSCDMICTSLTKMFSGGCNVMGGSIAINQKSAHYDDIRRCLADGFTDAYFPEDVLVMERNSADFKTRVMTASRNALYVATMLRQHPTVAQVFYPFGNPTQDLYERFKRPDEGYGYLLSIRFVHPQAAIAFHDALDVAKGPSLGTNFTLCCAYTLFAHYAELEWAAKFGVVEHLVRISVGIEAREELEEKVSVALQAAARTI